MQAPAHVVILLGPPGSGKGTQSARLATVLGIPAISTGEILRSETQSGSELGRRVETLVARGELVDDQTMNELVSRRLSQPDCKRGCILDGYPRTVSQARYLDQLSVGSPKIFDFVVSAEDVISRLGGRRYCPVCGQTYGLAETCERDGSPLLQRADDEPSVIRERLRIYRRNTGKLVRFYRTRDYHRITASQAPDMVFQNILRLLGADRPARTPMLVQSRAYA